MKAFEVDAVDTTGAGDVFHGCLALGVARNIDFLENLHRSSAVAALSCTRPGARTGIPSLSDLDVFLK
jgi:sugar/nucleoside kinase (ribokinase family)